MQKRMDAFEKSFQNNMRVLLLTASFIATFKSSGNFMVDECIKKRGVDLAGGETACSFLFKKDCHFR
jgi:hypothetical protein